MPLPAARECYLTAVFVCINILPKRSVTQGLRRPLPIESATGVTEANRGLGVHPRAPPRRHSGRAWLLGSGSQRLTTIPIK